jgi:hypothetical protein
MRFRISATLWLALMVAPATAQLRDGRDTPLAAARELYASARYDEALAVLNGLRPDEAAVPDRRSIAQYRSLCLLALGRGAEAEDAIASVVTADPLFQPNETDAAPRVRAAFSDVRQRLLPEIATSRYAAARGAYDRKMHADAERQFRELLRLLDDPQMGGRLGDMRVLVSGFIELSAAASAPPPPPPAPRAEPRKEEPPPPPAPVMPDPRHVYGSDDAGVTAPVAIRQELPRVPAAILSQLREGGLLEVIVDESGRVTFMSIRKPIHTQYDPMLLKAAKEWRYQPATFNGVPVKFRKLIRITHQKQDN